jgi:hypothetical protein
MKNKGRRHKSGNGPWANGNCKGLLCGASRPITQMSKPSKKGLTNIIFTKPIAGAGKWFKRKWAKRVRGYFKSQTKDIL